jgi:hypothetical protein
MSFEKLLEKYRVKAVYKMIKGDKIILGILSESEEVDLEGIAKSLGADEALLIRLEDPSTREPIIRGMLLVSIDDEYRKEVEVTILEKITEKKLQNIDKVIDEII